MSSFTAPLEVRYNHETDTWIILRDFEFYSGNPSDGNVVKVFAGEESDFASIPRPFRWLLPKSGKYNQATVVHDKMCRDFHAGICQEFYKEHRQRCDIFYEAMVVLNVPRFKRRIIYDGVLIGGPR